jgi:large subunit ribosomal protein L21
MLALVVLACLQGRRLGRESRLERSHMFAIVEAGGRQEKVAPGALVVVDHLEAEPGAEITLDKVLLVETDGGDLVTGKPYVAGATVTAVVEAQTRGPKIRVFRMKRRKHFRRSMGHRTDQTRIRVKSINV